MAASLELLDLDFFDPNDAIIALTFSSIDFRDIGRNKGTYSKTVKMPSTKANDSFFGMAFDVSSEGFFDPVIKVPIQISEIEFYGTLQLKSVEVMRGRAISYTVNIFGDLADWASLIGEGSIKELKHHSEHTLNVETIEASWSNNGLTGDYVYPLVSYGNFLQDKPSDFNIEVAFWRPAFFVLPLIRQTFKEIGWTFIDRGLVKTPLRDAILPFTSKEVSLPDIASIATNDSSNTYYRFSNVDFTHDRTRTLHGILEFNTELSDKLDIFDISNARYVVPSTGELEISVNIQDVFSTVRETTAGVGGVVSVSVRAFSVSSGGSVEIVSPVIISRVQSTTYSLVGTKIINQSEGDIIEIRIVMVSTGQSKTDTTRIRDASITITPKTSALASGAILRHSGVIQNVKKIDLIRDIIKRGNFRIVTDNQQRTVEFVQESEFLLKRAENWDSKVDESNPATISLIQNQGAKEIEWTCSNDPSDSFISDREGKTSTEWARKGISLESEYRKGSQTIYKSIFSSTIDHRGLNGLLMPVMSTQDLKQGEPILAGDFETNFDNRILIYDGTRNFDIVVDNEVKPHYPYSYFVSGGFSMRWDDFDDDGGNIIVTQASGLQIVTFQDGLVSRYYQGAIKRLNESKLYTGWFFLNDLDIANLDFRTVKIINGIHYYLNNVIDYKLNTNQPTKVELISR
jgi:hypothetical protein